MKYTRAFARTNKNAKEFESVNATLLIKAGYVDQVMAGVYSYLPLGLRVLTKIENIVREEMNEIGTEVLMPSIVPTELWEKTQRLEKVDVLMTTKPANPAAKAKNDSEYVLSPTHEEVVTPLAQKFNLSYKDFPFAPYQIQSKFRNEARPKSGLMRGREFRMKDMYSFHSSIEDFREFYERAKQVYFKVYERIGLGADTVLAAASGGDFTDDFSHEFQTKCDTGEDTIFYAAATKTYYNKEVAPSKAPKSTQTNTTPQPLKQVFGENIVGVDDLCKFLNITPDTTTKTLIFQTDSGVIVAAVRGDYEVNELKLKKVAEVKWLKLADAKTIEEVTGAKLGYAGILNLPSTVRVFLDDALADLVNFETGANKTNYHTVNINWDRDLPKPQKFYDIKLAKETDLDPETGKLYTTFKASEVGNIFPLYTKFTDAFNYKFTDKDGTLKPIFMGCYGLGTSRVMGVLVEKFHDSKGIVWPKSVAPFTVHLVGMNLDQKAVFDRAQEVYSQLEAAGVEVFFDDRVETSAGEKLADADLMGMPYRVIVSTKTGDNVELKSRSESESKVVSMEELIKELGK